LQANEANVSIIKQIELVGQQGSKFPPMSHLFSGCGR